MNNNFKRANLWIKVGIVTFIFMVALQYLYDTTNLVDWFDADDCMILFVVYGINILVETIIGCARWAISKIKNFKKEES